MKRILQIIGLIVACTMIAITFSSCYKDWLGKRPCDQYNTAWKSEDGSIHFYIGSGWGIGIAEIGDEKKEFEIRIGPATGIELCFTYIGNIADESWSGTFKNDSSFTAIIEEPPYGKTKYFQYGQTFKFYRVDDSEDEEVFARLRERTEQIQQQLHDKSLSG